MLFLQCAGMEALFGGERVAMRELAMLNRAGRLDDLRVAPGNRAGQYSIRVNDQFRPCFLWAEEGPEDVEIVDYH